MCYPRFGGGYPLSYGAGANFPQNIVREYLLGETVDFSDAWRDNTLMLRYDAEIIVPEKRRVVVFDLDDTLCKETDFLKSAFREIAESLAGTRGDVAAENLFAEMLEMRSHGENVFENLSQKYGVSVANLLARYRSHFPLGMKLPAKTRAVLETLKNRGAVLGIITDGRSLTQRNKIRALGLSEFFEDANIVVSEEFGSEKPSPENYEFFMKKYPDAEFCYVGDNPKKDFIAPNALGWETVCLLDDGGNVHPQDFSAVPAAALPRRKMKKIIELL